MLCTVKGLWDLVLSNVTEFWNKPFDISWVHAAGKRRKGIIRAEKQDDDTAV